MKIIISIGLLIGCLFQIKATDTVFYYASNFRPVDNKGQAVFYKNLRSKRSKITIVQTFAKMDGEWEKTKTERVKWETNNTQKIKERQGVKQPIKFLRTFENLPDGNYLFHEYKDEKLFRTGTTTKKLPMHLTGLVKEFYPNGKIKTEAIYAENQLMSNKNWLPDGSRYYDNLFYSVDKEPEYKLGSAQLSSFVIENLKKKNVDFKQYHVTVILGWVITASGEMEGVHVIEGEFSALNKKLVDTFQALPGEWEPARLNGEKVNYFIRFPVNMQSQNDQKFESLELKGGQLRWD